MRSSLQTLLVVLRKEFLEIFRNRAILAFIFILPLVQLIVLPMAASYEIKNVKIALLDFDRSARSRELVQKITASSYFQIQTYTLSYQEAMEAVEKDQADLILEIPRDFEKKLVLGESVALRLAINAISGTKASLSASYLSSILQQYAQEQNVRAPSLSPRTTSLQSEPLLYFNPHYNYRLALVPGILIFLISLIAGYLSALNIVLEKETGTIEQINVSPLKNWIFLLSKLIPFWILSMGAFTFGLFIAQWAYALPVVGSYLLLYIFVGIYLITMLSLGLLVSVYSHTQQQAMFVVFFLMMVFILMSGLFTPVESMSPWAQAIAYATPVTYGVETIRMIMLKGSGFSQLLLHFGVVAAVGVVFLVWSLLKYHKTS